MSIGIVVTHRNIPQVLFDASNLRAGGGVQVAASLIDEFQQMVQIRGSCQQFPWLPSITYHVSPEVYNNLTTLPSNIKIQRTRWSKPSIWLRFRKPFDAQLTVFGPRYGRSLSPVTITGIADGVSIYPWPTGAPRGSVPEQMIRSIRGFISRRLFKQETFLISESHSLLQKFHERTGYSLFHSAVVPNVVNNAVVNPSLNAPLNKNLRAGLDDHTLLFAYVARMYPHKNHTFLPPLQGALLEHGFDVTFVLTLPSSEWQALPVDFRKKNINVGPQPIQNIADLNNQCDAAIFPSLLESFSATPLEALMTNGLLFASDRPFVWDVAKHAACYFDPLDPKSAAKTIAAALKSDANIAELKKSAANISRSLPSARDRAQSYLSIIDKVIAER